MKAYCQHMHTTLLPIDRRSHHHAPATVKMQAATATASTLPAPRFVTGTCPKCGYIDARGDQCDGCGNLLNPTELINPKCKVTGTTPVVRSTRHVFLDLPQLSPKLQEYITNTSQLGGWSSNCVQVGRDAAAAA